MFRPKERKEAEPVNAGSMADIAFLLLIFFLVATNILSHKGLMLPLPQDQPVDQIVRIPDRNIFNIRLNSNNQLLVEGEVKQNTVGLQDDLKVFILNEGRNPKLSDTPKKAIVSLKTNRGTDYGSFIEILDEIKEVYYEIYGERVGLTAEQYRKLDKSHPMQSELYSKGKEGIPMNISIAEPDQILKQ